MFLRRYAMKKMLEICKITSVVGLKGEVKVQPWCDDPQLLCELETLYRKSGDPVVVERARVQKNMAVLKLKGTDTVEDAQKARTPAVISAKRPAFREGRRSLFYRIWSAMMSAV